MNEFRALLEQRRDGPDAVVTAAAAWASIERALADEPAFAACPPPARLRVWLQVLKQLVDEEHAAWEAEDRSRLRKERKRTVLHASSTHHNRGLFNAAHAWRHAWAACMHLRRSIAFVSNLLTVPNHAPCRMHGSHACVLFICLWSDPLYLRVPGAAPAGKQTRWESCISACDASPLRADRDAFCSMLRKHREQGLLQARTKWRRYRDIIRKDPEYLCMETNLSGSRPRELFGDVMSELEEAFFKVRRACCACFAS